MPPGNWFRSVRPPHLALASANIVKVPGCFIPLSLPLPVPLCMKVSLCCKRHSPVCPRSLFGLDFENEQTIISNGTIQQHIICSESENPCLPHMIEYSAKELLMSSEDSLTNSIFCNV